MLKRRVNEILITVKSLRKEYKNKLTSVPNWSQTFIGPWPTDKPTDKKL